MTDRFFKRQRPASAVKADIVSSFVAAWARIVGNHDKTCQLAYVDLFAGPGIYGDGGKGTVIHVIEKVLTLPTLRQRFQVILNDGKTEHAHSLRAAVDAIPSIELLGSVDVHNRHIEGGHQFFISQLRRDTPGVMFVDPFGYTGVTLKMFEDFFDGGDWGRDAVFFFNTLRINAALSASIKDVPMNLLFGQARAAKLRREVGTLETSARRRRVVEGMHEALGSTAKHVLPFEFGDRGDRLFFASRKEKGLEVMKKVMAKRSSPSLSPVPSFRYTAGAMQDNMFDLIDPLSDLCDDLLADYAGLTMTFSEVFHSHHVDQPYIEQNYREAILKLEAQSHVHVTPPVSKRRVVAGKTTLPADVKITFPDSAKREEAATGV